LGISPEGFGAVAMLVNFIVALVVNKFTPPPSEKIQELVERIRLPNNAGEAGGH
jgi:cation/acetate symporter